MHGITVLSPKMNGNVDENAGAAWTGGNAIFPIGSASQKPNIPRTWLNVTRLEILMTFWYIAGHFLWKMFYIRTNQLDV